MIELGESFTRSIRTPGYFNTKQPSNRLLFSHPIPISITLVRFSSYALWFQMSSDRLGIILSWDGVSLNYEASCLVWISRSMFVCFPLFIRHVVECAISGSVLFGNSFVFPVMHFSSPLDIFIFIRCPPPFFLLFLYFFREREIYVSLFSFHLFSGLHITFGGNKHAWDI